MKQVKRCPTCGAIEQNYRYGFATRYAYALKALYLEGEPRKISQLNITKSQKDHFHLMEYWGMGLIEREPGKDHHWRVTDFGKRFLRGEVKIPKYIWIYKAQNIPQPENDQTINYSISIYETGVELMSKHRALENSTPHHVEVTEDATDTHNLFT